MINSRLFILMTTLVFALAHSAVAEQRITLGMKILGAGWQGDNGTSGSSFDSTDGGQLGFNVSYKLDKFYTGVSLQGGDYSFSGRAPDQFTTTGRVATSNVKINQADLDLVAGYYFWPRVSLFLDIKAVANEWNNDKYQQSFTGLGVGATSYLPLNDQWTLFGSLGFIGKGNVRDNDDHKVGDGSSGALELGALFALDERNQLSMGLKFRRYTLEFTDNSDQQYTLNAVFFGYNHVFDID